MNGAPRRSGRRPARRSTAPFGLRPSGAVERRPQTGQFICSKTGHFYLLPTCLWPRMGADFSISFNPDYVGPYNNDHVCARRPARSARRPPRSACHHRRQPTTHRPMAHCHRRSHPGRRHTGPADPQRLPDQHERRTHAKTTIPVDESRPFRAIMQNPRRYATDGGSFAPVRGRLQMEQAADFSGLRNWVGHYGVAIVLAPSARPFWPPVPRRRFRRTRQACGTRPGDRPKRYKFCGETRAFFFWTSQNLSVPVCSRSGILRRIQNHRVSSSDTDILMRLAAFERVRLLSKMHDHLTQKELRSGFEFNNQRVPLVNPQRGIFKPRSVR